MSNIRKNLKFSLFDSVFFSLMVGSGEGYFAAFAIALGFSELQSGLLTTLTLVIGGILQLFVYLPVKFAASYRRVVFIGAILQACIFLSMSLISIFYIKSYTLLFALVSSYWLLTFSLGPVWNAWFSQLITKNLRQRFFSKRSLIMYVSVFAGMICSGLLLNKLTELNHKMLAFSIIFGLCFVYRTISANMLNQQEDVKPSVQDLYFSPKTIIKSLHPDILKVFLFVILFKIGVFFSASFFTPYMLVKLKFDYIAYMLVISSSLIGKVLMMRIYYRVKISNLKVLLFISSVGISLVPALWLLTTKYYLLFFVEVFSGIVWGSFEYSFFLIAFNSVDSNRQISILTVFNILNVIAILAGVMLGTVFFKAIQDDPNKYQFIFAISSAIRILSLALFPKIKDELLAAKYHLTTRPLSVRPNQGTIDRPVVASLNRKLDE